MAHGVNPAVKRVEAARSDSSLDRPGADSHGDQLRSRDDAVLPPSEAGDHLVGGKVVAFAPDGVVNVTTLAHAPDDADEPATEVPLSMPRFEHHSPKTLITNRLSRPPSNSA